MFFEGNLESGIGLALQQSKSIVCFARGEEEDEESNKWENEYLKDEEIVRELRQKAITLRLQAGSQEAGFLAAYFPLTQFPSLMIIRNSQLRGDLRSGISFGEFRRGLLEGLRDPKDVVPSTASTSTTIPSGTGSASASLDIEPASLANPAAPRTENTADPAIGRVYPSQAIPSTTSSSREPPAQTLPPQPLSPDAQATLAERRQRLEADRLQREAQELAEQQARKAEKASRIPARASQISHAQQERKRKQEARQERERILKIIENDKLERRRHSKLQQEYKGSAGSGNAQESSETNTRSTNTRMPFSVAECALRVRLFDGNSMSSNFPTSQNLYTHVRAWIDRERTDGNAPYSFKQIMAPGNNRNIGVSEEMESLQTLGLAPNATLLMVPAKDISPAYALGARSRVLSGVFVSASRAGTAVYAFILAVWTMVTGILWTFLGIENRSAPQSRNATADKETRKKVAEKRAESIAKTSGVATIGNVRTLRDRDERKERRQFYNGNQTNFEPRKDDTDDDNE